MGLIGILSISCILLFGLLGVFLLLGIRQRSQANALLGVFFLLWSLNFLDGWLMLSGFYLEYPYLAMWEEPFAFLYGPLIYYYAKAQVQKSKQLLSNVIPHLIPFIILNIITLFWFHLRSTEFKLIVLNSLVELQPTPQILLPVLIIFTHIFIYIFFTFRMIKNYQEEFKNYYSTQTLWLEKTLRYLVFILLLSLLSSFIQHFGPVAYKFGLVILIVSLLLFIVWIYFNALNDPGLFVEEIKYQSNPLSIHLKTGIEKKIRNVLEEDKIYLEPELTLKDLAENISEMPRSVSQVINEVFGLTFFDLINSYRIKECERIIKNNTDPQKTVLEMMYESGFNSKSSFNTQFKKHTGLTPSEFKKLHS